MFITAHVNLEFKSHWPRE